MECTAKDSLSIKAWNLTCSSANIVQSSLFAQRLLMQVADDVLLLSSMGLEVANFKLSSVNRYCTALQLGRGCLNSTCQVVSAGVLLQLFHQQKIAKG